MDSSFFLTTVAAFGFFTLFGTLFFMLYRKFRYSQNNKTVNPSSLSLSSPPSSLPRNCMHNVFPSFHGADIRKSFLSHIVKEFRRKGIDPFIDDNIERSKSIGPELIKAIKGSRIAIILLSRNYASSTWCLNELVEIMKCRGELSLPVMAVFYEVNPSDVKKQSGDFGKVFRNTCQGKTKENIERWRQALAEVAQIAGYDSRTCDTEAALIEKIATDVSNKLFNSTRSRDFDGFIGMGSHMEKIERVLRRDLDEVRMIGIWGPAGIGKSTIARCLFNQHSHSFDLSVFMENVKAMYTTLPISSDDYSAKLHLQQKFMSLIVHDKDIKVTHLGFAQDRLNDKRVLVVLDDVDQLVQLEAVAKETRWFGHGSRIIITTQNLKLLKAHGINHIHKVDFPQDDEAFQMFCMYAFGQKLPKDGFEDLAWEITRLAGKLPLGLRVMGSYFRGMRMQEWIEALPSLRNSLNGDIKRILKFSYDGLDDGDKELFLHIACFFNYQHIEEVEAHLAKKFLNVRQGLNVLAQKSLIFIGETGQIIMHNLLAQLGRDIVRKQSVHEPGQRQFLVDRREICELLTDDAAGSRSVVGIHLNFHGIKDKINISERAFEGMSNLQFLKIYGGANTLYLPGGLDYLSRKLRLLYWDYFPMTCLPSTVNFDFLVELFMWGSKLEKLWEGIKPLCNLRRMYLSCSRNLKELPDLSTATNLQILNLSHCSSLKKLPSTNGYTNNLKQLDLSYCSSLIKIPSSIGNATNLKILDLSHCSNLVELPVSIGNLQKLQLLILKGCSKLEVIPTNINLESFDELDLTDCLMLKSFPEISRNIKVLKLRGTAIEEVPPSIRSWSRLQRLQMSYCDRLGEFPHALDTITELDLSDTEIQEIPPWVKNISRLDRLTLAGCRKLVSLPQIPDSLSIIDAEDCESLERLYCSFHNPERLIFAKCFKLNQEARDLIIQTPTSDDAVLPGREVPAYFTHRATTGGSLTIKLNERPLPTSMRFKACILLVNKDDDEASDYNGCLVWCNRSERELCPLVTEHLYIFEVEAEVTSSELLFEFKVVDRNDWKIGKCGVVQISSC